jgi:hypothetical protein
VLTILAAICLSWLYIEDNNIQNGSITQTVSKPQFHPHEANFGGIQNSAQYNTNTTIH